MARPSKRPRPAPEPRKVETPIAAEPPAPPRAMPRFWVWAAVAGLLGLHYALAARSLVLENPTIDEIAHLPAGVTYWERGTFRLYHHNPPLVKLAAALPVVLAKPQTAEIYSQQSWLGESPSQATVGHNFALFNATRYFELFDMARLVIPLFSILGGVFVYLWSSRLYGIWGGLLSLSLWVFCPNILAHGRLVTSDVAAASFAIASTYFFWRYLSSPGWKWAVLSGILLGLAQLTKFSLLLLYGYWPLLWVLKTALDGRENLTRKGFLRDVGFGCSIVFISLFVINLGYGFEKSFQPLGSFEFCSASLTKPVPPGKVRPRSRNELLDRAWRHRENRFRGTFLEQLPVPLPYHYVAGFDEQKIESEGLPLRWFDPAAPEGAITGYSVFLNGQMRKTGWWYYYLATLAYKVPEGTWILILASLALVVQRRGRSAWFDELAILVLPLGILFAMSFLTDINLGLRYILPIFPFLYVGAGRVAAWIADRAGQGKRIALAATGIAVALTVSASIAIHPHYLAYFNWLSGGPAHGSEHLIDSNLDWGQDLVGLRRWLETNRPGEKIGLVYFGQFNPHIFDLREEPFDWFLPPPRPGTLQPMYDSPALIGPRKVLTPGLYAISASMLRGLPWRIYDPGGPPQATWSAAWNAETGAFDYFQSLKPITSIGYSILVYDLTAADCDRLNVELGLTR